MSALYSLGVTAAPAVKFVGEATLLFGCGGSLVGYNVETGEQNYLCTLLSDAEQIVVSPDRAVFVYGSGIFDGASSRLKKWLASEIRVASRSISPTNRFLAEFHAETGEVVVHSLVSGKELSRLSSPLSGVTSVAFVGVDTLALWSTNAPAVTSMRFARLENGGRSLKLVPTKRLPQTQTPQQASENADVAVEMHWTTGEMVAVQKTTGQVFVSENVSVLSGNHGSLQFHSAGRLQFYPLNDLVLGSRNSSGGTVIVASTDLNICVYERLSDGFSNSLSRQIDLTPDLTPNKKSAVSSLALTPSEDQIVYNQPQAGGIFAVSVLHEAPAKPVITELAMSGDSEIQSVSFSTQKPLCVLAATSRLALYALSPNKVDFVSSVAAVKETELLDGGFTCAALHPSGYLVVAALRLRSSLGTHAGASPASTWLACYAVTVEGMCEVGERAEVLDSPTAPPLGGGNECSVSSVEHLVFNHKGDSVAVLMADGSLALFRVSSASGLTEVSPRQSLSRLESSKSVLCFGHDDSVLAALDRDKNQITEFKCSAANAANAGLKVLNEYTLHPASGAAAVRTLSLSSSSNSLFFTDSHSIFRFGHGHKPSLVMAADAAHGIAAFDAISDSSFLVLLTNGEVRLFDSAKSTISDPLGCRFRERLVGLRAQVHAGNFGVGAVTAGNECHFVLLAASFLTAPLLQNAGDQTMLISRSSLSALEAEIAALQGRLQEMRTDLHGQMQSVEDRSSSEREELEERLVGEVGAEQDNIARLKKAIEDTAVTEATALQQAQSKALATVTALEGEFQKKYSKEVERCDRLTETIDRERQEFEKAVSALQSEFEMQRRELGEKHEDQVSVLRRAREAILTQPVEEPVSRDTQDPAVDGGPTIEELEKQLDDSIDAIKQEYEQLLVVEKDEKIRLRGQSGIHRKFHEDLKRVNVKKDAELQSWLKELATRREKIANANKDIEGLLKELKERERSIVEKDNMIGQLRKDQSELEKFKYVLDYKVKELKSIMEPKNRLVSELKHEVEDIEKELDEVQIGNRELERSINELDSRGRCLNSEIAVAKKELRRWRGVAEELQKDVASIPGLDADPSSKTPAELKTLKKTLISLHGKWILKTPTTTTTVTESDRVREYLENSVMTLKQHIIKASENFRLDSLRLKGEQGQLLSQLNALREEVLFLAAEKTREESQLAELREAIKTRKLEVSYTELQVSGVGSFGLSL